MAITTEKYIFSELLKQAERQRVVPNKTRRARDWFRTRASDYSSMNRDNFFKNATLTNTVMPGRMYMYVYDAKHKDTLPYWDAFPLIFPVSTFPGGFSGLNLHYLPTLMRARLMDALYSIANNTKYDDTTRLKISYNTLKGASNLAYFKPCYKQYLYGQVRSRFIYIEPKEWDIALFLPLQNFKKASASQVWRESSNAI